jgi:hypothetical protein
MNRIFFIIFIIFVTFPVSLKAAYGGTIYHSREPYGSEQARGFRMTPGIISKEGVYLSGNSLWYPKIEGHIVTFNLDVEPPSGWDAVSQGERTIPVLMIMQAAWPYS